MIATMTKNPLYRYAGVLATPGTQICRTLSNRPSPSYDTKISDVFDKADSKLLILGNRGTGKTTLLLELTRDLLKRAENEERYPFPVVLLLSSWATKQLSLEEWIVEELQSEKYQQGPRQNFSVLGRKFPVAPLTRRAR